MTVYDYKTNRNFETIIIGWAGDVSISFGIVDGLDTFFIWLGKELVTYQNNPIAAVRIAEIIVMETGV